MAGRAIRACSDKLAVVSAKSDSSAARPTSMLRFFPTFVGRQPLPGADPCQGRPSSLHEDVR